ncbi:MAG: AMP-dependent synthetase and ligase [Bryobacterales bacterium]|nr:AMP-dependent synthetase and ligase [Bryobacterales bacterium]
MFVPLTPLRCLHRAVDLYGSRTGVVCGGREFTYKELGQRAERLATGLQKLGIAASDRVAYLSYNNHQLLEGYYGVIQAHGIVMPLNIRLSEPELAAILRHSGAKMAIFENDFADTVRTLRGSCPDIKHWVALGEKNAEADLTYEEILDQGCRERADLLSYDEMAIAELFYTSGSTGAPKGVALSHRTLYLHALSVATEYRDPETMVDLHTIPLFHANGWGHPHTSTMLGVKQVMVRRFEPTQVFRLIQEHRGTSMCLVPTMANALINAPDRTEWDLSSLRLVNIGGAASSPELVERVERAFPGCQCSAGYGLTETSPVITWVQPLDTIHLSETARHERLAMTGRAVVGASVRVVDVNLRDVPRDRKTIGEVIVMGDQVMDGYFADPDATSAAMSGPWLHTGDMAVWDEEAYIQIVDRKKQIIISGGENISSLEVEAAIFAHPAVLECAVVAAPDPKWGEVPAAIIVVKDGALLTCEELLTFLQKRLSRFKLPRIVEFSTDPLPKTGTGKIRKNELRERFWVGHAKRVQG